MIQMEPEGSTDGFLRKKYIPFITGFEVVSTLIFPLQRSISSLN